MKFTIDTDKNTIELHGACSFEELQGIINGYIPEEKRPTVTITSSAPKLLTTTGTAFVPYNKPLNPWGTITYYAGNTLKPYGPNN